MVDFILVVVELFRYLLRLRRYKCKSKSAFFEGRWVAFSTDFRGKGASPSTNHCRCQKSRVIAVSCGIKISAARSFCFVTIHAFDRQTDGRTDRQTELRLDSNTVRCIT